MLGHCNGHWRLTSKTERPTSVLTTKEPAPIVLMLVAVSSSARAALLFGTTGSIPSAAAGPDQNVERVWR
jgi:hypothetical protein